MKTALLVIDAQKIYTDIENGYYVENGRNTIKNINRIIEHCVSVGDKIIYIRHVHAANGKDAGRMFDFAGECDDMEFLENTPEVEYSTDLLIVPDAFEVIKHRYDSFIGTNLEQILESNNIGKVIIVGFMTNFCCESTARSAHDRDYYVDFVRDATGTPGVEGVSVEDTIKSTCANLSAGFANVLETDAIL